MNALDWSDLILAHNPIVLIVCKDNRLIDAWVLEEGAIALKYMINGARLWCYTCLAINDRLDILQIGFEDYQYVGEDIQSMLDRPTWSDGGLL